MSIFREILEKHRKFAFSERDKGDRFERLMQAYLKTDPLYADKFKAVWLWNEFPSRKDLGGGDTGIDLVAVTQEGDYWAIQCKFFAEGGTISKGAVDSFVTTSGRTFTAPDTLQTKGFAHRLWISTTNNWGSNAEEATRNQHIPFTRLTISDLDNSPVDWAKLEQGVFGAAARTAKKTVRPHQQTALDKTINHFKEQERGKLIMACGTGKTFTSLRIAEAQTQGKGMVLFLVPSIALLGQTLREWSADTEVGIDPLCICSDPKITKGKTKNEDADTFSVVDLALPATTDVKTIVKELRKRATSPKEGMTVIFSTYQSIQVIAEAQQDLLNDGFEFDLIICDEAHRTTGVTLAGDDESAFVRVHDNKFIKAKKRLYMTATPKLYDDSSRTRAAQNDAVLCSMDDPSIYGEEIHHIGFGEAVELGLLADYKVLVLTMSDKDVPAAVQNMVADSSNEINSDDASKLIGCINALSKQVLGDNGSITATDPEPMRRALAFCPNIRTSRRITNTFNSTADVYLDELPEEERAKMVSMSSRHIDGAMGAPQRDELLSWLKEETGNPKECRVLTNVRCLSEGVDVPSLDAVMFLSARNSQVDVVQSVGRVMRRSAGKKYGYIIIPVIVPSEVAPEDALNDNERFKVVWTVLNALRAHDDRFNATINKIELNRRRDEKIQTTKPRISFDEDGNPIVNDGAGSMEEAGRQLSIQFEALQGVIYARMVEKVGDRTYWEQWAKSVAEIAERQMERINRLVKQDGEHRKAFDDFLKGLQQNINPSITQTEAVEMLGQHIITRPVFEALFEGYSFSDKNAISLSMQRMLELLEAQAVDKDLEVLEKFYESVRRRASGIDNAEGKQRIIIELYDKFFKTAFPKMVEKLGIVYTPVEVVDFIIRSVDKVLRDEFQRGLTDENIHILDPFTGTGTFMVRLLQSGLIEPKDLPRKYAKELHANEIVLLAYYIAAVNIENAFHDAVKNTEYTSFEGICLTDTFQLGETDASERLISEMFPQNSERVTRQKKAPLRVIMGNPPYSVGQKSANDNAQNQKYEKLDSRIAHTYAARTSATNKNSLYDSYLKAFRWSTDRLGKEGGIVAFVTNGAWLDGNSQDGFRKCLEEEFNSIYVFNLRGNARTQGELRQKEAGNVFGGGSRTPIAITLLVKDPDRKGQKATIHYHDIGDYLSREQKLEAISKFGSVASLPWQTIEPNEHGDWISQRDESFGGLISLAPEKKFDFISQSIFIVNSRGMETSRDAWVYHSSKECLLRNVGLSVDFFNSEVNRFKTARLSNPSLKAEDFIDRDSTKISWSSSIIPALAKGDITEMQADKVAFSLYRPFFKQLIYQGDKMIHRRGQFNEFFPTPDHKNLVICVSGLGGSKENSWIITDTIPDLNCLDAGTQCFPLHWYEEVKKSSATLFDGAIEGTEYVKRDGVSDWILSEARKRYGASVGKEDIFYYVYGFLHSPEYREKFSNDLKMMLPRLPLVESPSDFWKFSKAGRELADLHINYEKVPPSEAVKVSGAEKLSFLDEEKDGSRFRVEKMRFVKKGQKDTILFNSRISITDIPEEAYDYVVNGKSAIEWVMERYAPSIHKESGIRNDPNDWATETGNPRYILDLLLSVIEVSVRTVEVVNRLPAVKFE
jgi:predicted helicase